MPFMNGARDGAVMGKVLREAHEFVRRQAKQVVDAFTSNKGIQSNDIPFATTLSQYLETRRNESFFFSFNTDQINERANFAAKMLAALKSNDLNAQMKLLDDKEILKFKGFFSSRLYDMLVERRGAIKERLSTNKMEIVNTPRQASLGA